MEMETEDDVAVEGDIHVSDTGAATIVTDNKPQLAEDDVKMAVPENELEAPQ